MRQVLAFTVLASVAMAAPPSGLAQPKPDPAHGQQVFEDTCLFCHMTTGGGQGPTLVGVVGRKAANVPGVTYSSALQASGLTWTPDKLDAFLTNPRALVPGTAMMMIVPDPKDRADLIAYLASPDNKP
jgi:cytochrome c2